MKRALVALLAAGGLTWLDHSGRYASQRAPSPKVLELAPVDRLPAWVEAARVAAGLGERQAADAQGKAPGDPSHGEGVYRRGRGGWGVKVPQWGGGFPRVRVGHGGRIGHGLAGWTVPGGRAKMSGLPAAYPSGPRGRSAKPLCAGSIPARAFKIR